jgi:hypothetical protein
MLGFYNTKRRPAKAATTMVEAMAKSPVPGLPMTIVAAEDPDGFETLLVPLEVAALVPAVAAALPDVVVLAVLGYRRELVYVVQDDVAGIGMSPPFGGTWLSPTQDKNTFGA